jgi:hypothetical protein
MPRSMAHVVLLSPAWIQRRPGDEQGPRGGEFTRAPSFFALEPQPPNQTTLHEALAIASSKGGVSLAIEVAVALFTTPGDSAR